MSTKNYLIVVAPRNCPSCGAKTGSEGCDYSCPKCGKQFCSHCYKTNPDGPGTYVYCPGCNEKLYFPKKLKTHP